MKNVEDAYQLSPMQQGIVFHSLSARDAATYVEQVGWTIDGRLDEAAFTGAWRRVVERHPILRTGFFWEGLEEPLQVVRRQVEIAWQREDWRHLSAAEQEERFAELLEADRRRGFNLSRAPLMRLAQIRLEPDRFRFVWTYHHALIDGWSVPIVLREVFLFYQAFSQGQELDPGRSRPYRDFIAWVRDQDLGAAEEFWRRTLTGFTTPTPLNGGRPTVERAEPAADGDFSTYRITLAREQGTSLHAFARRHQVTLSTILQGAWGMLLGRHAGVEDVVFGGVVSGRTPTLEDIDSMLGLFVNTLPVRVRANAEEKVVPWLQQLHAQLLEMRQFEHSPLLRVQDWCEISRGQQLFESLMVFENLPEDGTFDEVDGGPRIRGVFRADPRTGYPLSVEVFPEDELALHLTWDRHRFDGVTIARMGRHFANLLRALPEDPDRRLADLPMLGAAERHGQLVEWNDTRTADEWAATVGELFEAQVRRSPEAEALVTTGVEEGHPVERLSYRELNRRANRLARHLRARGVGPEVPVGLFLERSVTLPVSVLAILKAGGVFVPLEPSYPDARLAFMIGDAEVPVFLTEQRLAARLEGLAPDAACLIHVDSEAPEIDSASDADPDWPVAPEEIAYLIFTSGTTGTPKAVMVEHRGLAALLATCPRAFGLRAGDRMPCLAAFSFDIFLFELLAPLVVGGTSLLVERGAGQESERLIDALAGATILHAVPALMRQVVETAHTRREELPLRKIFVGGDAVPGRLLNDLAEVFPDAEVRVLYGPTEGTILCSSYRVPKGGGLPLLGRPLADATLRLINPAGRPVPIGVAGEILISGPGVARGYLRREQLTAEKFPLIDGERAYRTGDLARFASDGNLEFLGRVDQQVKVRGFRVELGEVEAVVAEHPQVSEAVVGVSEDPFGDRRLVAWVVPPEAAQADSLRSFLADRLPDYMVPAVFQPLSALPLTAHGKIDRQALKAPEESRPEAEAPARTPTEEILAGQWQGLLGVSHVGRNDDFFELGGHSLLATRLVSRVRQTFGVDVPLPELFEHSTLEAMARRVEAATHVDDTSAVPPVEPAERQGELPLSFDQERLFFLYQLQSTSPAYNVPIALRLRGPLDPEALERSLNTVVHRHQALRTVFPASDGVPVQKVLPPAHVDLSRIDLSHLEEPMRSEEARRYLVNAARRPFDLARGPLVRGMLVKLEAGEHFALAVMHHIVSDGWSLGVLIAELTALYRAVSQGRPSPLPELVFQFVDFAVWQRQWMRGEMLANEVAWWRDQLTGLPPVLELPSDRPRPARKSFRGARFYFEWSAARRHAIEAASQKLGATPFILLLAVYQLLLGRTSGSDRLAVGSPIAGRRRLESEGLIGFFVNTLVLGADLSGDLPWRDLIHRIRQRVLAAYAHQDLPFEKLVEELQPRRDPGHLPLVQVAFSFQNAMPEDLELPEVELDVLELDLGTSKFDLMLELAQRDDCLAGTLEYDTDLFDETTIRRLAAHLEILVDGVLTEPETRLSRLPWLSASERHQVSAEWVDTASGYPRACTLAALFAEQVERTPSAVALVAGDQHLSYGELDRLSSRLASCLALAPGSQVGLMAERSPSMVAATLAILKAGGAYVPLDPSYPEERLAWLFADAGLSTVLAEERFVPQLRERGVDARSLEQELASPAVGQRRPVPVRAEDLAYVMYTSGSTGRPKGVAVTHRNVARLVREADFAELGGQVFLQLAPISFDASTLEIWGPLLGGGRLVLFPPHAPSLAELGGELGRHRIEVLWLTAGLFHQMVDNHLEDLRPVRQLLAGGDVLSPGRVRRVLEELPETVLINGYGPTENTTFTCCHRMSGPGGAPQPGQSIPIGRPIADTRVSLLDDSLAPVPVGVVGYLYAGGDGVSRGYAGRAGLSAERYVPDPSVGSWGDRLYATGDLARWLADGRIEFLGRLDGQVKLRGFRVELGEVESVLTDHPAVRASAAVIAGGVEDKRLVAYFVPEVPGEVTASALMEHLRVQVPAYMLPQALLELDQLPLDPNGKLDRRELVRRFEPETATPGSDTPRGPLEDLLAEMVAELLELPRVGVHDDFFNLGGHSLLATRLTARLRQACGVELSLAELFEGPTVAQLAARVDAASRGSQLPPLEPLSGDRQAVPLSFPQQRLWIIDQLDPGNPAYNISISLAVRGQLDIAVLESALLEVARRHEVLRTRFDWFFGEPVQVVEPDPSLDLSVVDLTGLPAASRTTEGRRRAQQEALASFDLVEGPLVRAAVLRIAEKEHLLLLTMHHIVADGWSMAVLLNEVKTLYEALATGLPSSLPELGIQYADFASWQRETLTDEVLAPHLEYWREQLRDPPVLELPTDRPRPSVAGVRGATSRAILPALLAAGLRGLARGQGATLFMALQAAFAALLARISGQQDIVMGSASGHRERLELEGLIGFFVNTQALRNDLSGDPSFCDLLARVRRVTLAAWAHQEMPFEKLVEELQPERDRGTTPLFQAMFAFQNAPVERLELPGLVFEPIAVESGTAKFDLYLALTESDDGWLGVFEYRTELFEHTTVQRWWRHLVSLIAGWVEDPERLLSELPLLSCAERHQIATEWADTASGYPRAGVLPALFAEQAQQTPSAVALVAGDEHVSFGELDRRSSCLASRLGLAPARTVGLMAERSPSMVAATLAILKAGGAYVPLDPSYPEERLAWLFADAGLSTVLAEERFVPQLRERGVDARSLEQELASPAVGQRRPVPVRAEDLAYVMYTSGSTGRPKGVAVTHRNVARLVREADFAELGGQVFLQLAPISFDASTLEIWGPLLGGGRLVLFPPHAPSLAELGGELGRHRIEVLWLTAGLFHQMVDNHLEDLRPVRQLLAGGDVLSPGRVRRVLEELPETVLINGYGPTENTTFTCCHRMSGPGGAPQPGQSIPIGRPIADTRVSLLDDSLAPVPVGVVGYLYAGGDGVSRGYAGRAGLSAERYVPDPSVGSWGDRLYATGDLARWLADGRIEFLGRLDGQVKLRGFRVELGEVESVLTDHPAVRASAAVIAGGVEDKRLVAYFVPAASGAALATALATYLRARLPAYMVPQALLELDELPLDPNGKLDRAALSRRSQPQMVAEPGLAAPRNSLEELLAEMVAGLLELPRVGIHDDFFDLGGHSLLATQLAARVRQVCDVELSLAELFEGPTVAQLAAHIDAAGRGSELPPLEASPDDRDRVPLSFPQQRLWILDQMDPGNPAYNISIALAARGRLDVAVLEEALREVARRHEVLRTRIDWFFGEPVQVVEPEVSLSLPLADLSGLSRGVREAEGHRQAEREALESFDLVEGPLVRAALLRLAGEEHFLFLTLHHIIADGWSMAVLLKEIKALYEALATGQSPTLSALDLQYADFAIWQRKTLTEEMLEPHLEYWRRQLQDPPILELPTDRPRSAASSRGATSRAVLPASLASELRGLARAQGATLFMALQAAFAALLARISGQRDIVLGSASGHRERLELEGLIGFFVNTQALRSDLSGDPSFGDLLARVQETTLSAWAHQVVPFEKLVEELQPDRVLDSTPFFQAMFALENASAGRLELPGLVFEPIAMVGGVAKFDLYLAFVGSDEGWLGVFEYKPDLFDRSTIKRWWRHLVSLIAGWVEDPERLLSELPLLSRAERHQIATEWADTASGYPRAGVLPALFAEQAQQTPSAVALVAGDEHVSFGELDRRSSCLASRLGLAPARTVGLMAERSPSMVAATLAILKAGGAYVPLDPSYPEERLAWLFADAGLSTVLAEERFVPQLRERGVDARSLEQELASPAVGQRRPVPVRAEDLAYVMYTSGSTGRPKGVAVTHRNVARLVREADFAELGGQVFLQLAPISFDASTLEIWGPLLGGGRLVLFPPHAPSLAELGGELGRHRIEVLWLTAGLFHQMVDNHLEDLRPVRQLLAGGDVLSPGRVRRVLEELPETVLINGYGPTENTTFTCCHRMSGPGGAPQPGQSIPIGRPIADTRVSLLDDSLAPVPVGVVGYLYAGGDGVSRGYAGRAGLSAERYVPDPSVGSWGDRLYATGDLARWLADGRIEFLGRLDGQVKLRGFRVELGEVESVLTDHPAVRTSAARIFEQDADKRLIGYYVAASPGVVTQEQLLATLRGQLPAYMVPQVLVELEALPLDPNGKLDRGALPKPAAEPMAVDKPRNSMEELLAGMVAELLELPEVGVHADFFDLGGHSLLATQLVSRVREAFGVELPLRELFEASSVAQLAVRIETAQRGSDGPQVPPIERVSRDQPLALSFAQQRLWFIDQMQPGNPIYNIPIALKTRGQLNVAALGATLSEVVRRHEMLRTRIEWMLGELVQIIDPPEPLPMPAVDLSRLPAEVRAAEGERLTAEESVKRFDLATGPLVRAALVRFSDDEHLLLVTMHHIVSDGWSMSVLVNELAALYRACVVARPARSPLPELPVQYADFAQWQRQMLSGETLERLMAYWRQQLDGVPMLELSTDRPRPPVATWHGGAVHRELPEALSRTIQTYARNQDVTLFMALMAAFVAVLSRAAGQRDVLIGSPIANRDRLESEALIGFFVNTLVLRTDLSGDPTFPELLARVRDITLGAYAHQELPFEKLVEELQPERSLSKTPFCQVMFALQNLPMGRLELPNVALDLVPIERELTNFELSLAFFEGEAGLICTLGYNRDLYDLSTIDRLWGHLAAQLENQVTFPQRRLSEHSMLSACERHQLRVEWNDTASTFPRGLSIPIAFADQAERTPEHLALEFGDEQWTYRRLARHAGRLAELLRQRGVAMEEPVGLCVEPGAEMVIGLLGILAAGGTYLPLDPVYPPERIRFMVEDSGAAVILAQEALRDRLPETVESRPIEVLILAENQSLLEDSGAGEDLADRRLCRLDVDSAALAYVTYTSGSTGRPKGIGIPHHAVIRLVLEADFVQLGPGDRVAQASNIAFDAATFEVWGALLTGATLVGVPRDVALSPEAFSAALRDDEINTLFLTTALFNQMAREAPEGFDALDHLLFGGEAVDPISVRQVLETTAPQRRLLHVYGPTENTTFSTWQQVAEVPADARTVPIGQSVAGSTARVIDRGMQLVPVSSVGELVLGGAGLARGYFGRTALTARRFVPDPSSRRPGARFYRTGDLVRRRVSGEIEFVGRFDHQVKLRGFRIELGEIEAILSQHEGISESAVLLRTDGSSGGRLVAYIVPAGDQALDERQLRVLLKEQLPEYMIPSVIVPMESLPLSAHGKVDRAALPAPEELALGPGTSYVAPRGPVENRLAEIMTELLEIERVGAKDDFFELGGHSLLATQLLSQIEREFEAKLLLQDLFEGPTVAELAARLEGTRQGVDVPPIEPVSRDGELPLSYAQQRLWFIDQLAPESLAYNIPAALHMEGRLDVPALTRTIGEIVRRHEVLRTRFGWHGDQPAQIIEPAVPQPIPMVDLAQLAGDDRAIEQRRLLAEESTRLFDLTRLPLLRLTLLRLGTDEHTLVVSMHHIITDGWSMEILVREVGALYDVFVSGKPSPLPELPIQYADFSVWQRRLIEGETLGELLAYWKKQLAGELPVLALPMDRRPARRSFRGHIESLELPVALSNALRAISNEQGSTLYMTLLASFQAFLSRLTEQEDVIVGTAVAGRTRPEMEGLIGFFVNMLPIRSDLSGDPRFIDLLQKTKETTLSAFAHQDIPLEKLIEELQPERQGADMPLFQVAFGVRGALREDLELSGLRLQPLPLEFDTVRLDLSLWISDAEEALLSTWHYSSDLFDRSTIVRMHERFEAFLTGIVDSPDAWVSTFEIRSLQEQETQLEDQARKQTSKLRKLRGVRRQAVSIPRKEES